jgi:beta-glucosidase
MKIPILNAVLLALTILLTNGAAQSTITSDTYFYGRSPYVPAAPLPSGVGSWSAAYSKAATFVAQLTQDEKNNLTYGQTSQTNGCTGWIPPITRLGFPGLCMQDAGNGVRLADGVSGFSSGIHTGAT